MKDIKYGKIVDFVHYLIENSYHGDDNLIAVDATVGKGNDTSFLCSLVGDHGYVYGFDVQESAIEQTCKLLQNMPYKNYELILDSHENLQKHVNKQIDICVFNLGYLPTSDKIVTTHYETSIKAISQAIELLSDRGRIYISSYILHDEGEESSHILEYISQLDRKKYNVLQIKLLNKNNCPPQIYVIENK